MIGEFLVPKIRIFSLLFKSESCIDHDNDPVIPQGLDDFSTIS